MSPLLRPRNLYRRVLALPVVTLAYLLTSGRLFASLHLVSSGAERTANPAVRADAMWAALLWLVALVPVAYAAWEVGREPAMAPAGGSRFLRGLREVMRRARAPRHATTTPRADDASEHGPLDGTRGVVGWAVIVAVVLPLVFASFSPELRTPRACVWLGVGGVLAGVLAYCRRKAAPYLREESAAGATRGWRRLDPSRYAAEGRALAWWQVAASVLLPLWWVGGALVVFAGS